MQGDDVWLKAKNLMVKGMRKLLPKQYRPFKVLECIGQVAYQLKLPTTMKIHDIFHLDLLTLYREMLSYSTNYIRPPPVTEESANSFPFNHHHLGIPLGIPHDPYCCWFLCSHSTLCLIHLLLPEHT